jgi:4-alpha-glucanotransferase
MKVVVINSGSSSVKNFSRLPIVAEDLGVITPDVREVMDHFALPGMKVVRHGKQYTSLSH